MDRRHMADFRLIVSIAAGFLLCAGAVPLPPDAVRDASPPGEAVWSDLSRDKLGPGVRPAAGPAQDGPGSVPLRHDGGRLAHDRRESRAPSAKPEEPTCVDLRLALLAPLKFATNYVDGMPDAPAAL